jgi:CBS domain containing-hemolysin-like protein
MAMSNLPEGLSSPSTAPAAPAGVAPSEPDRPRWWIAQFRHWTQKFRHTSSLRSDLQDALEADNADTHETPDFSPEERTMLKNILELRETRVSDVMIPRADIVAVPSDISLGRLLLFFQDAEHSRLPVFTETLDDPCGLVHIKDLMGYITGQARQDNGERLDLGSVDLDVTLASLPLIRPVIYVPPSMPAMELLAKMQTSHQHMALVIDEYGGTDGLVTIEDLVETVVGDIADEHDEEEGPIVLRTLDGAFAVDARASLEDVFIEMGIMLDMEALDEDVDTLGGLVTMLAGRVPARGEVIPGIPQFGAKLEFEVLEADPRRLKRIKIRILSDTSDNDDAKGPIPKDAESELRLVSGG